MKGPPKSQKVTGSPYVQNAKSNKINSRFGRVLFIDFMTSPAARSRARDDKKERVLVREGRLLEEGACVKGGGTSFPSTTTLSIHS
jgi:hypothetical protein